MKCIALLLMLSTVLVGCASSQVPVKPMSKLAPDVSQGTGFLVRSDGLVLTAFHVVEKGNTIEEFARDTGPSRGISTGR